MFNWLHRLFGNESSVSEHRKYESQQRAEIQTVLNENSNPSEVMKMLAKDFEERSLKEKEGGSSSSPISSS